MFHSVWFERFKKTDKFKGEYWMHSVVEARNRGIPFVDWAEGLKSRELGLNSPNHCQVEAWRDEKGHVIMPAMVIPVLYVDYVPNRKGGPYFPEGKYPNFIIALATKRWCIYANEGTKRTFWQPKPTCEWGKSVVRTPLIDFEKGFSDKEYDFVLLFMKYMAESRDILPSDAVCDAYKRVYPERRRKWGLTYKEIALGHLKTCSTLLNSGHINMNDKFKEAAKELRIDEKYILETLKNRIDKKFNMAEFEKLISLLDMKEEEKDNGQKQIPGSVQAGSIYIGGFGSAPATAIAAPPGKIPEPEIGKFKEIGPGATDLTETVSAGPGGTVPENVRVNRGDPEHDNRREDFGVQSSQRQSYAELPRRRKRS